MRALIAAFLFCGLVSCREDLTTPAVEAPERVFTQEQYEACLAYYANYVERRRKRYCNPSHDLGYFVDGVRQGG